MKKRRELAKFGRRGRLVRVVFDEGEDRHIVYYPDSTGATRRMKFGADKRGEKESVAWAEEYYVALLERSTKPEPATPITTRELWSAYRQSPAWEDLAPKSRDSYAGRWAKWERFITAEFTAEEVSLFDIDRFITRARQVMAINQVRQVLNVVRTVYRWGQLRRLINRNDFALHRWKKPKGAVVNEPEEYSREEHERLLFHLSPQNARHWRIHVALMIAGSQGQRANAVLHLSENDIVPAEAVGFVITEQAQILWPAAYQKMREDFLQPLTWEAYAAILTARYWKRKPEGREFSRMNHQQRLTADALERSPWVLPGHGKPWIPYGYQAMWVALRKLEEEARVDHKPYRALHGFRKMVAGDIADATGDAKLGMDWIGDKDPKQQRNYLKRRNARLNRAAEAVSTVGKGQK